MRKDRIQIEFQHYYKIKLMQIADKVFKTGLFELFKRLIVLLFVQSRTNEKKSLQATADGTFDSIKTINILLCNNYYYYKAQLIIVVSTFDGNLNYRLLFDNVELIVLSIY